MWKETDFGKAAAVFPGAGIGLSGYEASFLKRHGDPAVTPLQRASEFTGTDLVAAVVDDDLDRLDARDLQAFTYAFSIGVHDVILDNGVSPSLMAGHSLGIYAAMKCAGCVTFDEGLSLLDRAYRLAEEGCSGRECGMVATAGVTADEVDSILRSLGTPSLTMIITNSFMSMVVAGGISDLDEYVKAVTEADATRVVWLDREVAYHHPDFMSDISKRFAGFAEGVSWKDPEVPVVSSIDAKVIRDADSAMEFTIRNLCTPINWEDVTATLVAQGVQTVFECGPGTTLTRMGRFQDNPLKYLNVKKITRRGG